MESIIPIETDIRKFYKQYLNVIRPLLRPHLSTGELNVLAELMHSNYILKDIDPKLREKLVFDYDNVMDITENLNITYPGIQNIFSSLRKKDYLKGKTIKKSLLIEPTKEYKVTFKFNIK